MGSSSFFLICTLHAAISVSCGILIMFYLREITVFGHGAVTASVMLGSTPHDELVVRISNSFAGLLLVVIGCLLFMAGFVKDREFQGFFAKGCVLLHLAMAMWRVWFERRLEDLARDWPRQLVGDVVLALSWVFFLVYTWRDKEKSERAHNCKTLLKAKPTTTAQPNQESTQSPIHGGRALNAASASADRAGPQFGRAAAPAHEQAANLGLPLRIGLHVSAIPLVESPQIRDLLVRIPVGGVLLVGVAGAVRLRAAGGGVRAALDGGGAGGGGAGHPGDVDNGAGAAHVLRQAEEDAGGGGEEIDGGDYWVCGQGFDQGRESRRRCLCCSWIFCSC
ncbi:hypothetical protein C2S51_036476 [Perilla frutescens var. frutescens]|nr:hypothetical protein C2S51_036476 [Perilla frutescens var. frutescens]